MKYQSYIKNVCITTVCRTAQAAAMIGGGVVVVTKVVTTLVDSVAQATTAAAEAAAAKMQKKASEAEISISAQNSEWKEARKQRASSKQTELPEVTALDAS